MDAPRILAFAGSLRRESYNKKLIKIAVAGATAAGAVVTTIDLCDYPLPVFDADLETRDGLPVNAAALKRMFINSDGLMISAPEYNSSITGVLKNTIDWVSRPVPGEPSLAGFDGKIVTLMSASPGKLGGLRGLVHVRSILGNLGSIVLPRQVSIPAANDAFTEDGQLKDERRQADIEELGATLAKTIAKLKRD